MPERQMSAFPGLVTEHRDLKNFLWVDVPNFKPISLGKEDFDINERYLLIRFFQADCGTKHNRT